MATQQSFLLCDNSTAANFKNWAQTVSNFVRTAGWTNSSDTGQLNGAGAGPGGWASVSTVPGSGAFYYEIFQPGDGLQNFFLKLEYGNSSGSANSPTMRVSIGITTNGAGTLTGFTIGTFVLAATSYSAPSTTVAYECDFSGDSGRLSFLMWRNAPNNAPQILAIQRSLNASGSTYGTSSTGYITAWGVGTNSGGSSVASGFQQSLLFGVGACPSFLAGVANNSSVGWPALNLALNSASLSFNGSIPVWFLQPAVGFWDYPCTVVGTTDVSDLTEGVPFTVTNQYGQTKTYIPSRAGQFQQVTSLDGGGGRRFVTVLSEYD